MKRIVETSTNPRARITGVIYLLYFLTAIFAEFLKGRGFDRFSDVVNLIGYLWYAFLAVRFYYLFKPVNRYISLIAAVISLLGCFIGALALFYLFLSNISPLFFFGPYCLLIGWLIFRSNFLPRILGLLMILAGLGWLVFLTPLVNGLSTYIEVIGIFAEGSLMLWLIVMGVKVQRWQEQASAIQVNSEEK
jgi:hypothetical protein